MSAYDIIDEIVYSIVTSNLREGKKKEIFVLIRKLRVLVDPRIKQNRHSQNVFETISDSLAPQVLCEKKDDKG